MPKFLNEVWLRDMTPESVQGAVDVLAGLRDGTKLGKLPSDFELIDGPWLSNEEAKVYLVFEIGDPTDTIVDFSEQVADGLFLKRRLTLIQTWDQARSLSKHLNDRQSRTA